MHISNKDPAADARRRLAATVVALVLASRRDGGGDEALTMNDNETVLTRA
ncbi:hypothetical protein [Streptomyces sp. NPDC001978]